MKYLFTSTVFLLLLGMYASAQCPCTSAPPKPGMITFTGGTAKVCPGDTRTYTVANDPCVTYNWTPPTGGAIQSGQGTNTVVILYNNALLNSGVLSVTASNSCGTSAAKTKTIYKNTAAPAKPGVLSSTAGLCGLSSTTVTAPLTPNTIYTWSTDFNPPAIVSGQGTNTVGLNLTGWTGSPTNYLRVTATNGCGLTSAQRYSVLKLTPSLTTTIITGATSTCSFASHTYSVTPIPGSTSYDWKAPVGSTISDGVNSGFINNGYAVFNTTSTSVTVTYPNMSTFSTQQYVKAKGVNACGAGMEYKLKVYWGGCKTDESGLEIAETNTALKLYPNPASDMTNLSIHTTAESSVQLMVVNLMGEVLIKQTHRLQPGGNQIAIDVSQLPIGHYFVATVLEGGVRQVQELSVSH